MKVKASGLLLALALMLGVMALPASAAGGSVGSHVGAFTATAQVGKTGTCNDDGSGSVTGGGIGLTPELMATGKNAVFTISAGTVLADVSADGLQTGTANLCGNLTAPLVPDALKPLGIGATCLATKGWGGKGLAKLSGGDELWISNLGWKVTVGGTFLVTGDVGSAFSKKTDLLVAQVQALSDVAIVGCLDKTLGNKSGSQPFLVAATYEIVEGAGGLIPKKEPKK